MTPRWIARLAGALLVLATGCPGDDPPQALRAPSTEPGTCDGFADYTGELRPAGFAVVSQTPLGGGIDEVVLALELENQDVGEFDGATATPDLSAPGLDVLPEVVPADFGFVPRLGAAAAAANLVVRLPSANVAALLAELNAGTVPWVVHADERTVLQPTTA